jgi:predicted metal-dependent hydrolase
MTPPQVLEYVVAHEIAHLEEMNHSPQFWNIVDQLVPNAKTSRKWLKNDGQALMLILTK